MKIALIVFGVIAFAIVFGLLLAWPFMWIWNYAVVAAVSVTKPIGYWIAFWLMMFISLFVAGGNNNRDYWKQRRCFRRNIAQKFYRKIANQDL